MEFGASIFFTDYSITPAELGVALEERGFDSVWAAEHSHIPVPRRTRADAGAGKRYYDVMDPFVTLTAAACATKTLKVGDRHRPGHPARHDPDREAGRLDRPGVGRAVPLRHRRRLEPGGDREPRHGLRDAHAEDARADRGDEGDLDQVEAGIPRRDRQFDTMMTWPKPVQKPHPPIILGGAFPWAARRAVRYGDGWYPNATSGDPEEYIPRFRQMAQEAGRDPKSLPLPLGGAPDDLDKLKRFHELGVLGST